MQLTLKAARAAGAVSNRNTKMPGSTFAIDPTRCSVGSKLAAVEGSTCHKCYAIRLFRYRDSVRSGWSTNFERATAMIARDPEAWSAMIAHQVRHYADKTGERFHRWFDGGDLQSLAMLEAIARVCEMTPDVRHWMPTREAAIVKAYLQKHRAFPAILDVRVSSTMIDDSPIKGYAHTSTVHRKGTDHAGVACEASTRGNQCGDCRRCWDARLANVSYPLH
jgi:hypothetical protein